MMPKLTKSQLAGQLSRFIQQYARKAQKSREPNDRKYDRKLEERMKRLSPEALSELLSGENITPLEHHGKKWVDEYN